MSAGSACFLASSLLAELAVLHSELVSRYAAPDALPAPSTSS